MKYLIVANWKMNPQSFAKAERFCDLIKKKLKKSRKAEIIICPPYLYLPIVKQLRVIKTGAQNCFWEEQGAYTGEISLAMLKDLKCKYAIIGHSERRRFLNETNQMINKKIQTALYAKITPILCVGEKQEEKQGNKTIAVLKSQLESALKGISKKQIGNIIFAYEPVWAIGTGNACSADEGHVIRLLLQKIIAEKYSRQIAQKARILYGGSVNSSNVEEIIKQAGFQGVLIGKASLIPKEFIKITEKVAKL